MGMLSLHNRNPAYRLLALVIVFAIRPATSSAVDFRETARFNLDGASSDATLPYYIGSNPAAVAWSGSRLYVAGFNNSGATDTLSIAEVDNATASGLVDVPTFQFVAGSAQQAPAGRGYSGLDIDSVSNQLAAAFDDGSNSTPAGIQLYDVGGQNSLIWSRDIRGTSGIAFDPGFQGSGSGVASTQWGSGRRLLYDAITGATLFDSTDGMFWTSGMDGTLTRDLDFDSVTGDIFVRHNNLVSRSERDGGNSALPFGPLGFVDQADFVGQQNLGVLHVSQGDIVETVVIMNDRTSTSSDQSFSDVIRLFRPDGTEADPFFDLLDPVASGNGAYDFDFDAATNSLAILDFANRNVHIFEVGDSNNPIGDFNNDGNWDCVDIDALVGEIASGSQNSAFDLTGDRMLDEDDVDAWLATAGGINLASGNAFLRGDANLDGVVDVGDFNVWNSNKFTSTPAWCGGDFNADGSIDVADFNLWNSNKFQAADASTVPEPEFGLWYTLACSLLFVIQLRQVKHV